MRARLATAIVIAGLASLVGCQVVSGLSGVDLDGNGKGGGGGGNGPECVKPTQVGSACGSLFGDADLVAQGCTMLDAKGCANVCSHDPASVTQICSATSKCGQSASASCTSHCEDTCSCGSTANCFAICDDACKKQCTGAVSGSQCVAACGAGCAVTCPVTATDCQTACAATCKVDANLNCFVQGSTCAGGGNPCDVCGEAGETWFECGGQLLPTGSGVGCRAALKTAGFLN